MKSIGLGIIALSIGLISNYIFNQNMKERKYSLHEKVYYHKAIYALILSGVLGIVIGILQAMNVI